MHSPYYASPFIATLILLVVTSSLLSFYAAQVEFGAQQRRARAFVYAGIWGTAGAGILPGGAYPIAAATLIAFCIHIAAFVPHVSRRSLLAFGGACGATLCAGFLLAPGSERELVLLSLLLQGAHLAWRTSKRAAPRLDGAISAGTSRRELVVDIATFCVAFAAALGVSHFVLLRLGDSGDEWSYTYQAALFAKGRAYGTVPACLPSVRMFWVFWKDDRFFSMYTPGWPLFMTPFVATGVAWVAGPASLGWLVVAVGRLGRRACFALTNDRTRACYIGIATALVTLVSSGVLLMGASRYPHVFVAALWATCVELASVLQERAQRGKDTPPRGMALPALLLGLGLSWMVAARPAEGVLFAGPLLVCTFTLVWKSPSARKAALFVCVGAIPLGVLSLLVLRLQLGEWLRTGYDLNKVIYPWNTFERSLPSARELKWHLPLVTGGYCWMPLTPALGLAGLLLLRKSRAAAMTWSLGIGSVLCLGFFLTLATGRGMDAGYSPRYQFALVVPMAAGFAAAFAHARTRALVGACVLGVLSLGAIWPLSMRVATADIRNRNPAQIAAREANLHHAILFLEEGTGTAPPEDTPQNLPFDSYPPDVVYAIDRGPEARACMRAQFPGHAAYTLTRDRELVPR